MATGSIPATLPERAKSASPFSGAQKGPVNPRLKKIAARLQSDPPESTEDELQDYLRRRPQDADALYLLAQVCCRTGRYRNASLLLERALDIAPGFEAAGHLLARLQVQRHCYAAARKQIDALLLRRPRNPEIRKLKAMVLGATGDEEGAAEIWRELADTDPALPELWIGYGDALRAMGKQAESLSAYRRAVACRPSFGLAWWCLANMKTVTLDEADIASMAAELAGSGAGAEDRANLLFALGKAYEDRADHARAFEHYAKANAARRLRNSYEWDDIARELALQKALFTQEFLTSREDAGCPARDPIFVLGRPRSGSTLVEQILASHSAVEGTAELPYVADLAFELDELKSAGGDHGYPAILADVEPARFAAMGQSYMESARIHRRTSRTRFIDKAPANYHHIGLIALMLPNARIIDARRNPAACCFSMFKHNYVETNLRLAELGLVWRNYAELMAHFDRVLPGRIHRVNYESLIADPRGEIAKLLDYLALPFEENCLHFYESKRAVRSPSSEQVRRPISTEAVDHWRHFEPWLKPLLDSLGSALSCYPQMPEELR